MERAAGLDRVTGGVKTHAPSFLKAKVPPFETGGRSGIGIKRRETLFKTWAKSKKITVLIAEDHAMVREGLCLLLEAEGDIEIVCQSKTGREAVEKHGELHPDVTVMDIAMPRLSGLQAARQILKDHPRSRILMLSAHMDPEYIEEAIDMGAAGYLVKQSSAELLGKAIRMANLGRAFYSPSVSKHLREQYRVSDGKKGLVKNIKKHLTSREMEILQLIAEGLINKQIASELKISIKTVEKHRQSLMEKLNIHEIAGLTRFAMTFGIVEDRQAADAAAGLIGFPRNRAGTFPDAAVRLQEISEGDPARAAVARKSMKNFPTIDFRRDSHLLIWSDRKPSPG